MPLGKSDAPHRELIGWDLSTGKPCWHWREAHAERIASLAVSPDGRLLAGCCVSAGTTLWETRTGQPLRVVPTPALLEDIAFSPDSAMLCAVTGSNWELCWWTVNDGKQAGAVDLQTETRCLAFPGDPDTAIVVTRSIRADCSFVGRLHSISLRSSRVGELIELDLDPRALAVDSGGRWAAVGGGQGKRGCLALVDLAARRLAWQVKAHGRRVESLAFAQGRLASAGADQSACLWDLSPGKQAAKLTEHVEGKDILVNVALSPDGKLLAVAGAQSPNTPGVVSLYQLG